MTDKEIKDAKAHPGWEEFCDWAADEGVDPDGFPDDWGP